MGYDFIYFDCKLKLQYFFNHYHLLLFLTAAEKYLELETAREQLQIEKEKMAENLRELQRKLSKAQNEVTNTKLSMAQRTSQFQLIQEELLMKVSKTTKLEQEVSVQSMQAFLSAKLLLKYFCTIKGNYNCQSVLLHFFYLLCELYKISKRKGKDNRKKR